jgi:flagellin
MSLAQGVSAVPNNSINTNVSAAISLQYLNRTNRELDVVQQRVSTGLKVNGAVDDASSFSIAQGIRGDIKAYGAVSQGLSNGRGVANIALAAATTISDLIGDIKKKIIEGMNAANTSGQQIILNADFVSLVTQINTFIANANYNGRNLLSFASTSVNIIANIDGSTITLRSQSQFKTLSIDIGAQNLSSTVTSFQALSALFLAEASINTVLGQIGADTRSLNFQEIFVSQLTDAATEGLGSIVDADMAKESARLQALQVKQQLGVQTLNIANQRPTILQQLFR